MADIFKLPVDDTTTAIRYLYGKNIINGTAGGGLEVDGTITKAQFAVVTYRVLNAVGGGMGSRIAALKPGTKEYFSWVYLEAYNAVSFATVDSVENITPDVWNSGITSLTKSLTLTSFSPESLIRFREYGSGHRRCRNSKCVYSTYRYQPYFFGCAPKQPIL